MACHVSLVDPAVPDWDFVPVPTPPIVPLLYYMNGPIPSRRVMMTLFEKAYQLIMWICLLTTFDYSEYPI